jgi:hypothetical protein
VENAKAETRAAGGGAKKAQDRASDLEKTVDCQRWEFSVDMRNALQVQANRVKDQVESEVERVKVGPHLFYECSYLDNLVPDCPPINLPKCPDSYSIGTKSASFVELDNTLLEKS